MITLGYDFYDDGSIQKPNGLIGQKISQKNTKSILPMYTSMS